MTLRTLTEAAAMQPSKKITGKFLYRQCKAGHLRHKKIGNTTFTTDEAMEEWSCLEKSSRPASTFAKAAHPAGSSEMATARSAQATAQATAKMLMNSGKPSASISQGASRPQHPRLPRIV